MIASQYPDWVNVTVYCCIVHSITLLIAAKLGSNPEWGWIYRRQLLEVVMLLAGVLGPALSLGMIFHNAVVGGVMLIALSFSLFISYRLGQAIYEKEQEYMRFRWKYTDEEEREEIFRRQNVR